MEMIFDVQIMEAPCCLRYELASCYSSCAILTARYYITPYVINRHNFQNCDYDQTPCPVMCARLPRYHDIITCPNPNLESSPKQPHQSRLRLLRLLIWLQWIKRSDWKVPTSSLEHSRSIPSMFRDFTQLRALRCE